MSKVPNVRSDYEVALYKRNEPSGEWDESPYSFLAYEFGTVQD